MSAFRDFDLGDILSITEGSLVSPRHIDGVYDILNFMTGDSLFTHALPRAANICAPVLLEQHPQLIGIEAPKWREDDVEGHVNEWLTSMKAIHGDMLPVTPLASWQHIDPIQELVEMVGADRVIPVVVS